MDKCEHIWLYIGSKRQKVWRCTLCDEYRLDDPKQKKEWQGLTDEEVKKIYTATEIKVDENWRTGDKSMMFPTTLYEAIEAKLKEKNT